jgi:hypothetical protein
MYFPKLEIIVRDKQRMADGKGNVKIVNENLIYRMLQN